MNINALNREETMALIQGATQAYYGREHPIISDTEFDALIEHLREIDPDSHVPYSVGFGYKVDGIKRPHRIQTGGMPKIKEGNGMPAPPTCDARVTPKYDGLSITAYYKEDSSGTSSILEEILTRGGDEGWGKPVTHNLFLFFQEKGWDKLPSDIMAVGMEAVVTIPNFVSSLSRAYELPRSAAAGILQARTKHEYSRFLEARPFRIYKRNGEKIAVVDVATEKYFQTVFGTDSVEAVDYMPAEQMKQWAYHIGVPVDGVILWGSVALKFETDTLITTVIRIERNISRLGRLVPVLVFQPVKLFGTTISRCMMVNESWIKLHEVGPGAVIEVTKANEIIPAFVRTVSPVPYVALTACPVCGGPVHFKGADLFCKNNCAEERSRLHSFIFTFAGLLGYSSAALKKVLAVNAINTFDEFLSKAGHLTGDNLTEHEMIWLQHLNRVFSATLDMNFLLVSLTLPGIGWKWSEKLAPYVVDYLNKGTSFPFTVNYDVLEAVEANKDLILKTYKRFIWTFPGKSIRTPVTITGSLSIPRDEFCQRHNLIQVPVHHSLLLITPDLSSDSSKMRTAKAIGAKILSEEDFVRSMGRLLS